MAVSSTETVWKNEGTEAKASRVEQIQIRAMEQKRKQAKGREGEM